MPNDFKLKNLPKCHLILFLRFEIKGEEIIA